MIKMMAFQLQNMHRNSIILRTNFRLSYSCEATSENFINATARLIQPEFTKHRDGVIEMVLSQLVSHQFLPDVLSCETFRGEPTKESLREDL
mmetsp:Transcript_29135/g.39583  ORF Transcript_29135/g.39583 Transcript_29135/m.39583 type:complete len:92 (-) Transcript_29135:376-651(-)